MKQVNPEIFYPLIQQCTGRETQKLDREQHANTSLAHLRRSDKELRKLSFLPDEQYKSEPVTGHSEATYWCVWFWPMETGCSLVGLCSGFALFCITKRASLKAHTLPYIISSIFRYKVNSLHFQMS